MNAAKKPKFTTAALLAAALLLGTAVLPGLPAGAAAAGSASASAAAVTGKTVNLTLNGKALPQKAALGNEGTLIPLAAVRDGLGLKVAYDANTKSYSITRGTVTVQLLPTEYQSAQAVVNGSTQFQYYEWRTLNYLNSVSVHVLTDDLGYSAKWDNATQTVDLAPLELNNVNVTAQKIEQSDKYTTISVEYPQLSGLADTKVQTTINQMFKDRATAYIEESLKRSDELGLGPQGAKNEFDGYYTVAYNRSGVISFRMLNYDYTGGAHGMSYLDGITLRLSDGKQLELADLMKGSDNYLTVIDKEVAAQLAKNPGYFGGFESAGEKPAFYLKEGGVVVFFQLYQYLPYAAGFPEYLIPFSKLLPEGTDPFAAN